MIKSAGIKTMKRVQEALRKERDYAGKGVSKKGPSGQLGLGMGHSPDYIRRRNMKQFGALIGEGVEGSKLVPSDTTALYHAGERDLPYEANMAKGLFEHKFGLQGWNTANVITDMANIKETPKAKAYLKARSGAFDQTTIDKYKREGAIKNTQMTVAGQTVYPKATYLGALASKKPSVKGKRKEEAAYYAASKSYPKLKGMVDKMKSLDLHTGTPRKLNLGGTEHHDLSVPELKEMVGLDNWDAFLASPKEKQFEHLKNRHDAINQQAISARLVKAPLQAKGLLAGHQTPKEAPSQDVNVIATSGRHLDPGTKLPSGAEPTKNLKAMIRTAQNTYTMGDDPTSTKVYRASGEVAKNLSDKEYSGRSSSGGVYSDFRLYRNKEEPEWVTGHPLHAAKYWSQYRKRQSEGGIMQDPTPVEGGGLSHSPRSRRAFGLIDVFKPSGAAKAGVRGPWTSLTGFNPLGLSAKELKEYGEKPFQEKFKPPQIKAQDFINAGAGSETTSGQEDILRGPKTERVVRRGDQKREAVLKELPGGGWQQTFDIKKDTRDKAVIRSKKKGEPDKPHPMKAFHGSYGNVTEVNR
jgi:hypothetical protein